MSLYIMGFVSLEHEADKHRPSDRHIDQGNINHLKNVICKGEGRWTRKSLRIETSTLSPNPKTGAPKTNKFHRGSKIYLDAYL